MRTISTIVLASLNKGKQDEFKGLFAKHNIKLSSMSDFIRNFSFLERVESASSEATYEENAFRKCQAAFLAAKVPTLADDSGIEIDILGGAPGVLSAHFGSLAKGENQNEANRKKVLESLKGKGSRSARMRCTLVFLVEGLKIVAEGVVEGAIAEKEAGSNGFGYDSIFIPQGANGKTFAELSEAEKGIYSHRARAVDKLVAVLREKNVQLVRP